MVLKIGGSQSSVGNLHFLTFLQVFKVFFKDFFSKECQEVKKCLGVPGMLKNVRFVLQCLIQSTFSIILSYLVSELFSCYCLLLSDTDWYNQVMSVTVRYCKALSGTV